MVRKSHSLNTLFHQCDLAFPNRSRASDGWIGDPAHQSRQSYHNPINGIVYAGDFTHDPAHGFSIDQFTNQLAASGDTRLYEMIANGLYWHHSNKQWVRYTGSNPHTKHAHITTWPTTRGDNPAAWDLPMFHTSTGDTEMTREENIMLRYIFDQLIGEGASAALYAGKPVPFGWNKASPEFATKLANAERLSLVDYARLDEYTNRGDE